MLEAEGYRPERFIWIHAQADDARFHREVAERGAYVERIESMVDQGYADRLLVSQDRGWYDPSEPGGGDQRPYTYLVAEFLPTLRAAGVDDETVRRLTRENPFDAYAR